MGKHATKAGENIFTQARYNAAKFNDRLNSREGASEELGIDRSRLARIELGSNYLPACLRKLHPGDQQALRQGRLPVLSCAF